MKINYQPYSGGRVGGVRPPYRDHHVSKIISVICGLDMPSATRPPGVLYETY